MQRAEILIRREPKNKVDATVPIAVFNEWEPDRCGGLVLTTTVLLTGAECRFACTMCDLWRNTLNEPTPTGSLAKQLRVALSQIEQGQWIKLYNSSNFFDPRSVPAEDLAEIAELCRPFDRVIVENHPRLLRPSIEIFQKSLRGKLEIAMGLETIYEPSLSLLNKEATLDDFKYACRFLLNQEIDVRAFVLLQPPATPMAEAVSWAVNSTRFAWEHGVRHVSIIPTRGGNGAMEYLADQGLFSPPTARQLEECLTILLTEYDGGTVTDDLWDWDRLVGHCERCRDLRRNRLDAMNRTQRIVPMGSIQCGCFDS